MVGADDVRRVVADAARLLRAGRLVVFGSSALVFWLEDAPRTRDVDVWCEPAERGDILQALMGELSWYDEKHGAYVEVWAPETFAAPADWRTRARELTSEEYPDVTIVVPHPHDVVFAKLSRMDPQDDEHARRVHREFPFDDDRIAALASASPLNASDGPEPDAARRFAAGLERLRALIEEPTAER